jgi:hypothetical protein
VGAVLVDVADDEAFELASVPDDRAIEEFSPDRSDPPLGERVRDRGAHRGLEDLEVLGSEHLVEGVGELAAAVADQGAVAASA